MRFLYKILTIRRILLIGGMLYLLLFCSPSWFIGNYISNITGSPVKADFSLIELLRGNVKFNRLTIYSPANYGSSEAVVLNDLKINLNLWSLFNSQKVINEINVSETSLKSIYYEGSNNINDVINNSMSYFANKGGQGSGSYIIKELFLRNIHLKTFYYSKSPISSKIADVYIKDIKSDNNISETVTDLLAVCFADRIDNDYQNNVSWWDKTTHAIGSGINFTVNAAGTGLNLANNAVDTANSLKYTFKGVNKTINSF
jgi:hypothetical protein